MADESLKSVPNPHWKEPEDGEIIGCGFRGDQMFRQYWDAKTKSIQEVQVGVLDESGEEE